MNGFRGLGPRIVHGREQLVKPPTPPRVRRRVLVSLSEGTVIFPNPADGLDDEEFFYLVNSHRSDKLKREEWLVFRCSLCPEWADEWRHNDVEAFAEAKFWKVRAQVLRHIREKFANYMANRFPPYEPPPPPYRDPWATIEWEAN